ncbi:MAG: 50S ribosomal protein L21 [Planctomycetes bacterium]|nr:50S ribosomal protein L21 [Planctomycetota bacterium]
MYAVIQDGGHQYRVEPGTTFAVQLRDLEVGSKVTFDKIAAIGGDELKVGKPFLAGASVEAIVTRQFRGEKITIGKYRRRKNYRRKTGHRQNYTEVRVESIQG